MKVRLLHRDRAFDLQAPLPWNAEALIEDLGLRVLFEAMAGGDAAIFAVARSAILSGFDGDVATIRYRQDVLDDCLRNPEAVREMYAIAAAAMERESNEGRSSLSRNPDWVLRWASATIESFLDALERLHGLAEAHQQAVSSTGMRQLLASMASDLGPEYCTGVRDHLRRLKLGDGVLIGAGLGRGNGSGDLVLLEPQPGGREPWLARLLDRLGWRRRETHGLTIDPADEVGAKALAGLRDRGLALAAGTLGESADHIRGFLDNLRRELAFYVGCLNLRERLASVGMPTVTPTPAASEVHGLAFKRLCNPVLALTIAGRVVGNDAAADGRDLIIVTGANQGGKSTFLRSLGLAQLMMQCGLFVVAEAFSASITGGIATHFRREEDAGMDSGKLDDELARMSVIVDHVEPHMMILLNESFAATNEREGSEIAHQIVSALTDRRIRVVCVTHFHELARRVRVAGDDRVLFLRAERRDDGTRSFAIVEGEPLSTSFGDDLYDEIFHAGPRDAEAQRETNASAGQAVAAANVVDEGASGPGEGMAAAPARTAVPPVGRR
jgi:hypothetical protein